MGLRRRWTLGLEDDANVVITFGCSSHVGGKWSGLYQFVGRDHVWTGPVDEFPQDG